MDLQAFQDDPLAANVEQTLSEVIVAVKLPGSFPNVNVEISSNAVKISGAIQIEKKSQEGSVMRHETSMQSFQRIVNLPALVKTDGAKASTKNGVLTITLQKLHAQELAMKKIPIENE